MAGVSWYTIVNFAAKFDADDGFLWSCGESKGELGVLPILVESKIHQGALGVKRSATSSALWHIGNIPLKISEMDAMSTK